MTVPVVVMGVAGCGKSTVGQMLADRLSLVYEEADGFHPPENVGKMARREPLDDADRAPWLAAIAQRIIDRRGELVVSCSALKRCYRDVLRAADDRGVFVHLDIDRSTAEVRVASRPGHFMPAALVVSQFEDLEPLEPDETGGSVDATAGLGTVVAAAARLVAIAAAEQRPGPHPSAASARL